MTDDRHGIGGNNPPSEEDEFTAALEAKHVSLLSRRNELTLAGERAPEEINDEATAKKAADFLKQIIAHENSVEKERKVAKAPHFNRGKWVDAFFNVTAVKGMKDLKARMGDRLTAYQQRVEAEERRRREERERAEREEAERLRREAEERKRSAETEHDTLAAAEMEREADAAEERAERAGRAATASAADLSRSETDAGTVASLRTEWKCTAWRRLDLNLEKLRPYLGDAHIETAIRAFIRDGGRALEGATIEEVSRARVS